MAYRLPLLVFVLAVILPGVARAAMLNLAYPDVAMTSECTFRNPERGPLEYMEVGGVRFEIAEQLANRYPCAPLTPEREMGMDSGLWPLLVPPDGLDPIMLFLMDQAHLGAESDGVAILGVTLRMSYSEQGNCSARVLGIPVCGAGPNVDRVITFADFGIAPGSVHGFSLGFFGGMMPGGNDPFVQLVAVEVPEPALLMLFGVGLALVASRRQAPRRVLGMCSSLKVEVLRPT